VSNAHNLAAKRTQAEFFLAHGTSVMSVDTAFYLALLDRLADVEAEHDRLREETAMWKQRAIDIVYGPLTDAKRLLEEARAYACDDNGNPLLVPDVDGDIGPIFPETWFLAVGRLMTTNQGDYPS